MIREQDERYRTAALFLTSSSASAVPGRINDGYTGTRVVDYRNPCMGAGIALYTFIANGEKQRCLAYGWSRPCLQAGREGKRGSSSRCLLSNSCGAHSVETLTWIFTQDILQEGVSENAVSIDVSCPAGRTFHWFHFRVVGIRWRCTSCRNLFDQARKLVDLFLDF